MKRCLLVVSFKNTVTLHSSAFQGTKWFYALEWKFQYRTYYRKWSRALPYTFYRRMPWSEVPLYLHWRRRFHCGHVIVITLWHACFPGSAEDAFYIDVLLLLLILLLMLRFRAFFYRTAWLLLLLLLRLCTFVLPALQMTFLTWSYCCYAFTHMFSLHCTAEVS